MNALAIWTLLILLTMNSIANYNVIECCSKLRAGDTNSVYCMCRQLRSTFRTCVVWRVHITAMTHLMSLPSMAMSLPWMWHTLMALSIPREVFLKRSTGEQWELSLISKIRWAEELGGGRQGAGFKTWGYVYDYITINLAIYYQSSSSVVGYPAWV